MAKLRFKDYRSGYVPRLRIKQPEPGQYLIMFSRPHQDMLVPYDGSSCELLVEDEAGGDPFWIPRACLIDVDKAVEAVAAFLTDGEPCSNIRWSYFGDLPLTESFSEPLIHSPRALRVGYKGAIASNSTLRPVKSSGRFTITMQISRITLNPAVMGGKPCIRGLRVTVGTVLGLLASGHSRERILKAYPYLEPEDIDAALAYAAWRLEEREEELVVA